MNRHALVGSLGALVLLAYFVTDRFPDAPLQIGAVLVLVFVIVLVVRYVLLLWLGYLHHIESRADEQHEVATSPVTIIVPSTTRKPSSAARCAACWHSTTLPTTS